MAALAVSLLAVAGFCAAFAQLGVVPAARGALDRAGAGASAMLDPHLSDDEKEAAVRAAGIGLVGSAWGILWRVAAALLAAALPLALFDLAGVAAADDVAALMLRWDYIAATAVLIGAAVWLAGRARPASEAPAGGYSAADRLTHRLAFAGPGVQLGAAALEDRLFARSLRAAPDRPPVFVTGLPRAGTTILLEALHRLPGAATHLYRDMPFVMAPLMQARLRRLSPGTAARRERAHGDGLMIGLDSPEAFEEVIWRAFWPEKYDGPRIALWREGDADAEAAAFFRRHFRKIVALRAGGEGRYVSKNNGNIARLDLLPAMFPDCRIVAPVRDPAEHAASLLRQHLNFAALHREDPFVARYMEDVGHLEFGALHKPVDFPGFDPGELGPEDPDYWLAYWIAAHRALLAHADRLLIVPQELVAAQPDATMRALAEATGLGVGEAGFGRLFRRVALRADRAAFDPARLAEAAEIHGALAARAIRPA